MKLNKTEIVYVRSMGKALRVTGIFTSDEDANKYLEKNKDEGIIAQFGVFIFTANYYDRGVTLAELKNASNSRL